MGHSNKKVKALLATKPAIGIGPSNSKASLPPKATQAIKTPQGTIRKGTRRPYRKPTNEQMEKRVEELAAYIRRRPLASRFELHKEFCPKFGVKWDHIDGTYTPRARKLLAKQANMSRAEARELGLQVVTDLMSNGDPKTRLAAEKSFREIHGYSSPTQTRIGGPDGQPLAAPVTVVQPQVNFIIPGNDRSRTNGDKITNGKH